MFYFRSHKADAYRLYLWMSAASSFFFTLVFSVNMVYQVQTIGLSPLQLVLVGTTLETSIFLFEIPTGIVADVYSRRLSIIIGFVLVGLGFVVEGSIPAFGAVLVSQVLWGIGYTFTSGAQEAWITDEIGEERIGRVFMRASQIRQLAWHPGDGGCHRARQPAYQPANCAGRNTVHRLCGVSLACICRKPAFILSHAKNGIPGVRCL